MARAGAEQGCTEALFTLGRHEPPLFCQTLLQLALHLNLQSRHARSLLRITAIEPVAAASWLKCQ